MVYHSIWTPHHKHHLHGAALCDRCRTSKNDKQLLHSTFRYLFHACQQEVYNKVQPTVCRMGSPRAVEREAVQPEPRAALGRSARHDERGSVWRTDAVALGTLSVVGGNKCDVSRQFRKYQQVL